MEDFQSKTCIRAMIVGVLTMSTNKTKPTSDLRTAGSLLLISGSLFYFLNMAAESIYPKYSDGVNALSDLGA